MTGGLCKYDAIISFDHAPVSMTISFKNVIDMRAMWRLNTHLLSNEDFVGFSLLQTDLFVSLNKAPDVSAIGRC